MPQNATLTHRQETFLLSLLSLPTLQAACLAAQISDETARRWLRIPEVRARYEEMKREYIDTSLNELIAHTSGAIATLARHMTDSETPPPAQIRAAQLVLEQVVGLHRLSALEKDVEELRQLLKERPQ